MPRIDSFKKLLALISSSILTLFGIIGIVSLGIMEKIFGTTLANEYIYPITGNIFQILAYIAVVVILVVMVLGIIDYSKNRNKKNNVQLGEVNRQIREKLKSFHK
jgi:uncharacterized BrkB/YihY/UPF0761 family membrane protein